MTEWRLLRGWTAEELRTRLDGLGTQRNFDAAEEEMTAASGWHHYHSEAVIAREPAGDECFSRARTALANYQFSDPAIVVAHFDPKSPFLGRRVLLEIKILALHYLCSAIVSRVRDEPGVYGFRYDTLHGHIERGMEWFLLTKDERGDVRFRIEARWQEGDLPNWWSRAGFRLLSARYQRRWHRQAHRRLSQLAHAAGPESLRRDRAGLTHQGADVTLNVALQSKVALMNRMALTEILTLGTATGMRSFSGPAVMAMQYGRPLSWIVPVLAAAEMVADKTPVIGNRTDPAPLAGRAVMGALVGALISRRRRQPPLAGALAGAAVAVLAAHAAFHLRARMPLRGVMAGLAEDAVVAALCARAAR